MQHTAQRLATLFAFLLTLTPALVFGQASFEAQVRGVVHDATGGVIICAKVTITDVATNISSSTATDGRGYFIFNGLHPSTYNLKAEMGGFRAEEMKNVVLAVSQRTNVDFTLNVAGLGIVAAVISVLIFHQGMWALLHYLEIPGMTMPPPYPTDPIPPFGGRPGASRCVCERAPAALPGGVHPATEHARRLPWRVHTGPPLPLA